MTNDLAQQVPAGWYADPSGATAQRWWDGGRWTEHVAPAVRPVRRAGAAGGRRPMALRSTPCGSGWSIVGRPLLHRFCFCSAST